MFTGLVEAIGTLVEVQGSSPRRLVVRSELPTSEINLGGFGCHQWMLSDRSGQGARHIGIRSATETLGVTTLGALTAGRRVHLERALRVGDRLDGHLVAGHVDGIGTVAIVSSREVHFILGSRRQNR